MIFRVCALALLMTAPLTAAAEPLDIRDYEAAAECVAETGQLEVTIEGVTPVGILAVELYRPSKRHFLKKASRVHRIRIAAGDGPQSVCFNVPEPGRYAVATYHDKDADRDLDQKWNGMPKEPFGLSTNAKLKFGFPKFKDADFEIPAEGTAITIVLVRK